MRAGQANWDTPPGTGLLTAAFALLVAVVTVILASRPGAADGCCCRLAEPWRPPSADIANAILAVCLRAWLRSLVDVTPTSVVPARNWFRPSALLLLPHDSKADRSRDRSKPTGGSRLLHFCGTSPLGRRLRKNASAIQKLVAEAGGADVRVFGSVATGRDREGSDIDLIFTPSVPMSLMRLGRLEQDISHLVGVEVDLVPESALKPHLRERVLAEAVAL